MGYDCHGLCLQMPGSAACPGSTLPCQQAGMTPLQQGQFPLHLRLQSLAARSLCAQLYPSLQPACRYSMLHASLAARASATACNTHTPPPAASICPKFQASPTCHCWRFFHVYLPLLGHKRLSPAPQLTSTGSAMSVLLHHFSSRTYSYACRAQHCHVLLSRQSNWSITAQSAARTCTACTGHRTEPGQTACQPATAQGRHQEAPPSAPLHLHHHQIPPRCLLPAQPSGPAS